ncbi:hypothetical protein RIF29_06145 [Crotalaria pallida]|uniref:Uncharacterized protein n=1 Tax=Crotalaria pallida TaxID=3830 RepID=A0AAN9J3X7_CROPI
MAQKKQPFRFRIPWLLGTHARPAAQPVSGRPKDRSKSPTKPDTSVPIQRPQSPPSPMKTQGEPKAEPEKQSPTQPTTSSVVIESSMTSQSEPPSLSTTPTAVNSSSPSLQPSSHAGSPTRVSIASSSPKTQPQSPTHSALDGAIMVSKLAAEESTQPASSASTQEKEKMVMSETMPQEADIEQHQPPFHTALDGTITVSKIPAEESTQAASSASKHEKEKMVVHEPMQQETEPTQHQSPVAKSAAGESSQPASSVSEQEKEKIAVSKLMPQEAEPKVNSPLEAINKSPDTFSQPENLSTQPTPILGDEERSTTPKARFKTKSKSPETSFQPEMISTQPVGSEPSQASSVTSSSQDSETEPAAGKLWSSSPLASARTSEVLKSDNDKSTFPPSPVSQNEKEKKAVVVSEPLPQETHQKINSPLKIIPKSPETSSRHENLSRHSNAVLGDEERSKVMKAPLETKRRLLQSEEKEKLVRQPIKAGKSKDTTSGQPVRRSIASSSGTQDTDSFTRSFREDKKHHRERRTLERKIMFATASPSEKNIRVVSSADQGTRNVSSISPERPVSSNEGMAPLQKGIKDDISKFVHKLATVNPTHPMDDKQFGIITLAGDNRGATMHVGFESVKKEGSIHIHRAYKTVPNESTEATTDGEESNNTKKDSHSSIKNDEVGKAYVNSNIQSINNSLMFHGSVSERDPGVQVTLPQEPLEPIKSDDKLGIQTYKTEFNVSHAERSTYQPIIRRRCLRGLFVEPSDSDPDNPDKPLRHGCKVSCDENKEVQDIEDL